MRKVERAKGDERVEEEALVVLKKMAMVEQSEMSLKKRAQLEVIRGIEESLRRNNTQDHPSNSCKTNLRSNQGIKK